MRLFIAVWVDEVTRKNVAYFLHDLSLRARGIKWTPPEQLHFTMKFLGEQKQEMVGELLPFLKEVGKEKAPFSIILGGGGVFSSRNSPRVLWLGLKQGAEDLKILAQSIEQGTKSAGLPQDNSARGRSFKPHLTVGRVKSSDPVFDRLLLERGVYSEMVVSGFSLVESVLTGEGPVYKEVERFPLG